MELEPGGNILVAGALAFHDPAAFGPDTLPGAENLPKGPEGVVLIKQTAAYNYDVAQ